MSDRGGGIVSTTAHTETKRFPTFERIYLYCPEGHEVVSAPVNSYTGQFLVRGDFSREWCSYGSCSWRGTEAHN